MWLMLVLAIVSGPPRWLVNDFVQPYADEASCKADMESQIDNLNGQLKLKKIDAIVADAKCVQKPEGE
jgi:hypothetical protein